MSIDDEPVDRVKPEADVQEQERAEAEQPDDPESVVVDPPFPGVEADSADVADQRREEPLDDDRRDDGGADDITA